MRHSKTLRILALTITLSLLMVVIPATPVLAAPAITLSPTSGATGTRVTVAGKNFDSYRGDNLSIFFNNVEIADSPVTIPETGNFSVTFDIPDDAVAGIVWITIKSQIGSKLAESSFSILETEIKLDIEKGTVGTVITVDGKGFYADKMVTCYYDNKSGEKLGSEVTGPTGEFSYSFTIPESAARKYKIIAENAHGNSAEADFKVIPLTNLNPTSGTVGDVLTVSGTGFGYRSEVNIYFEKTRVAYAKTDKFGSFEGTFSVPVMKADTYDVKVEDEDGNTDRAGFTIAASASLNKNMGNVGIELTASGTGFTANGIVIIKYDALEVAKTTANNKGTFSIAFNVPVSISGEHLVTVSDGSNIRQLAFTMESEAPPAPTPLVPEMGVKAKSPLSFHWEAVDDPSLPITYSLQVASDSGFTAASIVLAKESLTKSEYTLTEEKKLQSTKEEAPYYWRVKAIDSAANESEWSSPGSFYVGSSFTLPGWVIYTLIGLGALLIGFLAFWLGRRTTYYAP